MYTKLHKGPKRNVLAICDEDIIGKCFKQRGLKLEVNERFYKGEKKTEQETLNMIEDSQVINLTGQKTINLFLKKGIIKKHDIIEIDGVPHAQIITETYI